MTFFYKKLKLHHLSPIIKFNPLLLPWLVEEMAFLQGPSPKQEEIIKQELNEIPGEVERGLRDLRSMCAANPYLPNPEALGNYSYSL